MKRISVLILAGMLVGMCQSLQSTSKGSFQKRMQRVTPTDIQNHTRKILVNKYHYQIEESNIGRSSIFLGTSWKDVNVTKDEKEKGFSDVRVRFRVRSRETRTGPENTYSVHSLKFTGEVQAYQATNSGANWMQAEITPQRRKYLEHIYKDYKLEFDSGSMDFN